MTSFCQLFRVYSLVQTKNSVPFSIKNIISLVGILNDFINIDNPFTDQDSDDVSNALHCHHLIDSPTPI